YRGEGLLPRMSGLRPQQSVRETDDRGGVEAPREAGADRNVGAQTQPNRVGQQRSEMLNRLLLSRPVAREALGSKLVPPRSLCCAGLEVDFHPLAAAQLAYAAKQRTGGVVENAGDEKVARPCPVEPGSPPLERAELLDLGSECPVAVRRAPVVERVDAEAVAGRQHLVPAAIDEHKRKLAVEA